MVSQGSWLNFTHLDAEIGRILCIKVFCRVSREMSSLSNCSGNLCLGRTFHPLRWIHTTAMSSISRLGV